MASRTPWLGSCSVSLLNRGSKLRHLCQLLLQSNTGFPVEAGQILAGACDPLRRFSNAFEDVLNRRLGVVDCSGHLAQLISALQILAGHRLGEIARAILLRWARLSCSPSTIPKDMRRRTPPSTTKARPSMSTTLRMSAGAPLQHRPWRSRESERQQSDHLLPMVRTSYTAAPAES